MEYVVASELLESVRALKVYVTDFYTSYPYIANSWYNLPSNVRRQLILSRIEECLNKDELTYPSKDLKNVYFHEGYGLTALPSHLLSFSTLYRTDKVDGVYGNVIFVLRVIKQLLQRDSRTTKRDIYYQNVLQFQTQADLDRVVAIIASMLQVPRLLLGVMATSKGLVVGDLIYTNCEDVIVDCRLAVGGETIPQDVAGILDIKTDASYVLVVEKDAIFQRMLEEGILLNKLLGKFILITGKGMPDLSTRQLVQRLSADLCLPVLVLTDCDPYGIDIMACYRFGSLSMACSGERLAVPSLLWLGLLPTDVRKLQIPRESLKPLSSHDSKRLNDLAKRPYFANNNSFLEQLDELQTMGRKAEIQNISEDPGFITNRYLIDKIASYSWI